MREHPQQSREARLEREWLQLFELHLPVTHEGSPWRYHRTSPDGEPPQGWKLHLSATVLNASRVLKKIAPLLTERGVQFKAPRSLQDVIRLNSGISAGCTQVGKVITVYSRTSNEAVQLAKLLHKLTARMAGPSVPFDLRYTENSNVYYRFGGFQPVEIKQANGKKTFAIRGPDGKLIPDDRQIPKPDWVADPFENIRRGRSKQSTGSNPLAKDYRIIKALVQRGKGGVYQAVDLTGDQPRLCLIKEGRRYGEVGWDGRDGNWRIKNEEQVLRELHAAGLKVPQVFNSFELDGNAYIVTEFVDGESLHHFLARLQRRIKISLVLNYGVQLATFFIQLHSVGWVWRDCKLLNIILTPKRELRPLDFEGSARIDRPDLMLWGTPGFIPPEWRAKIRQTGLPDDLYALGAILYLLITGRTPKVQNPEPPRHWRKNLPDGLNDLIMSLLDPNAQARPQVKLVLMKLRWMQRKWEQRRSLQTISLSREVEGRRSLRA